MDFDLSQDQSDLRDAAAAFLAREASVDRVRGRVGPGTVVGTLPGAGSAGAAAGADAAPSGFDESLWSAMVEQGWPAVEVPEPDGGLGWGMVEVAVLCEQLGRRVAPAPFLPTVLALGALVGRPPGDGDVLAELVSSMVKGDAVGCVLCGSGTPSVASEKGGDGQYRLSGVTAPAPYAPSASVAVVVVGEELFAVPRPDGGPWSTPEPAMDRTRELGRIVFDRTPAVRLGGPEAVARFVDRGATALSAELLGVAEESLDLAVEYAKQRVQFGKPIGSFQAVKHRLADALVDVEGMRSTVYYAAWCTSVGDPDASLAASMAKAWCSDASRRVLGSALQVHGGIGFTWEHQLHWYLKRGQLDQVSFGDAAWHRDRIASVLRERLDAGQGVL